MTDSNLIPGAERNPAASPSPEHSSAPFDAAIRRAFTLWPNIHLLRARNNGAAEAQPHDAPLTCDEALAHVDAGGRLGLVPWSVRCVVVVCDCGEGMGWADGAGRDVRDAVQLQIDPSPLFELTGSAGDWAQGGHLYYHAGAPITDRDWAVDGRRGGSIRGSGHVTLWDLGGFADYVLGEHADADACVTSGGLTASLLDLLLPKPAAEPDPPPPEPVPSSAPAPDPADATPADATPTDAEYAADTKPAPAPVPASDDILGRLVAAQTPEDIVHTMWVAAWQSYCGRGEPPPPPTVPELERWLADCRWSLPHDTALFQALAQWDRSQSGGEHILGDVVLMLHRRWLRPYWAGQGFPDEHHPVAPLIRRRLALAVPGTPFTIRDRASLPRVHKAGGAKILLPGLFPMDKSPQRPSIDLPPISVGADHCPHWLLWLFDQAGGVSMRQGRGAPWALRLFIGALLHMPVADRDGRFHTYRLPLYPDPEWPDVPAVIEWLFPGNRRWRNKTRDWHKLPEALNTIKNRLSHVPVTGADGAQYLMSLLVPTVIPTSPDANLIEFMIRLPGAAAGGARLDWSVLSAYGTEGAVIYRAYLSAVAMMDKSARGGHPITSQIATPLLGGDGKPIRGRGGRVARSKTDVETNPSARYVPALTDADLTRLIGLDPTNRHRRRRAREAFERLDADGHIELVQVGGGRVKIFGPK